MKNFKFLKKKKEDKKRKRKKERGVAESFL